ncbi:hypothetical protein [Roseiconus lacunae]|uniref:hypothetical protein n=1 Tax=Roseiconus lacunae TaxID=2605694 RepID=UPI001E29E2A4|nr:hypothetical protein [Roseiconus lacunae]MCD0461419.1 hypothetical protein [Roseiconus lacunae]
MSRDALRIAEPLARSDVQGVRDEIGFLNLHQAYLDRFFLTRRYFKRTMFGMIQAINLHVSASRTLRDILELVRSVGTVFLLTKKPESQDNCSR